MPMLTQEQIILSTLNGYAFAILENRNFFTGIYKSIAHGMRRVKLNMYNHNVTRLNQEEMDWTPVGSRQTIYSNYRVLNINFTHLH